jgi:DNA repair protein RecO (recombination protein O)
MPARRDEAFVLTRYPYQERDLIVVLLTRSSGQVRALARRARGARSPLATAVEPLARVQVSYFERAGRELVTLDEAQSVRSSFPLAARPEAWASGQLVAELATVWCPPGQRSEAAFRLVDRCIEHLLGGGDARTVSGYALLWFLKLGGVMPETDRCGQCGAELPAGPRRYDVATGVFACAAHATSGAHTNISAAGANWLRAALREPVERAPAGPPAETLGWLVALHRRFSERPLASLAFLERLLGESAKSNPPRPR